MDCIVEETFARLVRKGTHLDQTVTDPLERLQRGLQKSNTTCAVRESRVRLSPHFYNTEEEIDRLLSCL